MNLDRAILKKYTKYPFTDNSTLKLSQGYSFPAYMIQSFNIQVSSACRCYIHKIQLISQQQIKVYIRSSKNNIYWFSIRPGHIFSLIQNQNKCPAGSVKYKTQLYASLLSTITLTNNSVTLSNNTLQIMSQCITIIPATGCQAICINSDIFAHDLTLCFKNNVRYDHDTHIVSIFGDLQFLTQQYRPILNVQVCNQASDSSSSPTASTKISSLNRQLIIKPAALSDLRVRTSRDKIQLLGVSDV